MNLILYIFIGNDEVIKTNKIITILDYQLHCLSLKKLIDKRKKLKQVSGNEKEAKSIIVTDDYIYFSSLSTYTLKKRDYSDVVNNR